MSSKEAKRVLLITGSDIPKYQLQLVPTAFYTVLEEPNDVVWDHAVTAEAALAGNACREYDALVFFCFFKSLSETAVEHLRSFVRDGRGILVVHSALASFPETEMWAREIVGVRYHHDDAPGRQKTISTLDVAQTIRPVGNHPICEGFLPFELVDEAYKGLEAVSPVTPLFETDHPSSDGAVVWIGPSTKSRTVVLEPGHTAEPFQNPAYREILDRCLHWVAQHES
jgi:type 1 glutamine amidotransferase